MVCTQKRQTGERVYKRPVAFRLPDEVIDHLKVMAEEQNMLPSHLLEKIILEYLGTPEAGIAI
ncbi:MAG: CopG family transcriptional regulator [Candidatus Eremiobacteraeota bacterium]|nr:CopG family transcriptional regulator [Candidatus Eremiobacteraeota bacterium]